MQREVDDKVSICESEQGSSKGDEGRVEVMKREVGMRHVEGGEVEEDVKLLDFKRLGEREAISGNEKGTSDLG